LLMDLGEAADRFPFLVRDRERKIHHGDRRGVRPGWWSCVGVDSSFGWQAAECGR
jgi:hypothetical protein